jgi:hypothetical protein
MSENAPKFAVGQTVRWDGKGIFDTPDMPVQDVVILKIHDIKIDSGVRAYDFLYHGPDSAKPMPLPAVWIGEIHLSEVS